MFSKDNIKDTIIRFLGLDSIMKNLSGYAEARLEVLKIEVREDVAKILSRGLVYGLIFFFGFLCLIFLSIGLALFINRYFDEPSAGFWMVAAAYLVAFMAIWVFREGLFGNIERHFLEMIKRKSK